MDLAERPGSMKRGREDASRRREVLQTETADGGQMSASGQYIYVARGEDR